MSYIKIICLLPALVPIGLLSIGVYNPFLSIIFLVFGVCNIFLHANQIFTCLREQIFRLFILSLLIISALVASIIREYYYDVVYILFSSLGGLGYIVGFIGVFKEINSRTPRPKKKQRNQSLFNQLWSAKAMNSLFLASILLLFFHLFTEKNFIIH